jgi:hypothetical protein
MEPAGLAAGTVNLAGLVTTCLQLYEIIDAGKKFGVDYEVVKAKLGRERIRLLHWGEKVGLVADSTSGNNATQLDSRLGHDRISIAVWEILGCIKMLFEDTDALRKNYGLKVSKSSTCPASATADTNTLWVALTESYKKLAKVPCWQSEVIKFLG